MLLPGDWEAQFTGNANERATLRAIVGEISIVQTVAGTNGGAFFWGLYAAGTGAAAPAFTTGGMGGYDWLHVGCRSTTSVATSVALNFSLNYVDEIRIKAKRKLTSNTEISIAAQFSADPATPSGFASGLLRFLVARD